jgi:2-polyprenyl-3-methyl-5-hydroxy-6-metoxy-1,4-benzoquinol methylase
LLVDHIIKSKDARILIPGCGDSLLSEKLVTLMNQKNVLSIDYEDNVIQRMKERGETGVQYQVKDCTKLEA